MAIAYHCDRDHRGVGEDEGDFIEHAAAAPVLGESHPISIQLFQVSFRRSSVRHLWNIIASIYVPSSTTVDKITLASCNSFRAPYARDQPVAQSVGHDHRRGVLLQRRNNKGGACSHFEVITLG